MSKFIKFTYQHLLKPVLFLFDPERIHNLFHLVGKSLGRYSFTRNFTRKIFYYSNAALEQEILGIKFKNPVGVSEGFDKDANLVRILPAVGFGFMQIGSITLHPYEGNSKPRLYRLKKSKAIIVNYGLKNIGVNKIIEKLKKIKLHDFPLSISVAKTNCKETADIKKGIEDYYACLDRLLEENIGDFYTINISCPNAFGGETYAEAERLNLLLKRLKTLNVTKPLFLKMPINLEWNEFKKLLDVAVKYEISGVVIGNLTKVRDENLIKDKIPEELKGGISGKPCYDLSNELIFKTYEKYYGKLVIVGVGGIFSAKDAYEKIKRGASLVQLITGMIFEGPQLIGEINKGLVDLLGNDGYSNIAEAVGAYHRKETRD
jgi:dihydroorotate dehydrogenase